MRKFITIISLFLSLITSAQINFNLPPLNTDYPRPGAGYELWNDQNGPTGTMHIPVHNGALVPMDAYFRFSMNDFFANPTVAGDSTIIFTRFDQKVNAAKAAGQVFGFRIMSVCNNCDVGNNTLVTYNNGQNSYPKFLHDLMQAEAVKDWLCFAGDQVQWIPNWNSVQYYRWVGKLMTAVKAHINSTVTTTGSIPFSSIVRVYDLGFYGDYSEQHSAGIVPDGSTTGATYPAGTFGTFASLDSIASKQIQAMRGNGILFTIPFNSLDGIWLSNTNNPWQYGKWLLDHPDSIGFRLDHLSDDQNYDHDYLERNFRLGANQGEKDASNAKIQNRWRYSLIRGEPPGYVGQPSNLSWLPQQVINYHINSFGNGNYAAYTESNTTAADNARLAAKNAGHRLRITGGSANAGASLVINMNWINVGVTPTYENWTVQYLLKNGNTVVSTLTSSFNPIRFLPSALPVTKTDVFGIPAIPTGTYGLYIIVKDALNYRQPYPLAITTTRQSDGSYFLGNLTLGGGTNQNPVADAGVNQSITTSTATLTGSGTDADGTIVSYLWTQMPGGPNTATIVSPNSATTNLTGLIGGSYVFNLLVTDDDGAVSGDNVTITVNLNTPPVANAGPNKTITLPTSSTTMAGSATDNISVASTLWTKVGGPSTFVITTPGSLTTTITGLTTEGVYTFRLTATDGSGLTNSDDMTVTVNPGNVAPVANAGANITITLPTTTATLNGSATDDSGTPTLLWTQVGGPITASITSPASGTTGITGLSTAGFYMFRLRATDSQGLTHSDDVQVTVNATVNTAPVANAGANQIAQIPVTNFTVLVDGSLSTDNIAVVFYSWAQVDGPAALTITAPTNVSTYLNNMVVPGTYVMRLTVTDGSGLTGTDEVTITTLAAANNAPVAVAGGNIAITLPTSSTVLDGSGSSDDNAITAYLWTKFSGPAGGTIATPTTVSTNITSLQAGTYVFRLRVQDASGLFDTDDLTITVNPAPNNAPVADAGANQTTTLPTNSVTQVGSGTDDNAVTGYLWTQTSGPSIATISAPTSATTNFNNLVAGIYFFQLQVTDGALTDTDEVMITVNPAVVVPPVIGGRSGFRTNRKFLPRN